MREDLKIATRFEFRTSHLTNRNGTIQIHRQYRFEQWLPYSCSHFNMRNWHHNITNRNKIASSHPRGAWGGTLLSRMSSRLKPIVNWAISMKIAFCARFLSEFVVEFITIAAFRFLRELNRSDFKFKFQMFKIIFVQYHRRVFFYKTMICLWSKKLYF